MLATIYLYVCIVGTIGGVNAYLIRRKTGDNTVRAHSVKEAGAYILIGIFAGWIVYEISEFFTERSKIRLAAAAIASFGGEDILSALSRRLRREIEKEAKDER
ncbi:MAG: hypothetical protein LBP51_00335 [Deferribacteraceae bacterium]|jgi:uncharacterized membrane protein|nr:hypothetical protein [Deferribacteraceae bacterium]